MPDPSAKLRPSRMTASQVTASPPAVAPQAVANRLLSLDVFRGATIASMMLVNNPGNWAAVYKPLLHAEWHGWTFTDLIFPFFLWIVGVAVPLSTDRRLQQGQTRRELFFHAFRRAAILFSLGLFLNAFSYLIDGSLFRDGLHAWCHNLATNVRIPGVLQRIAICYLGATGIFLWVKGSVRAELSLTAAMLLCYWALMMVVPVPAYGPGVLEKQGNFSQYVDNLVLNGPVIGTHVWKTAGTWDPEGIISTIPAIATCLFGILTGQLLRTQLTGEQKTSWMFTAGAALLFAGSVMDLALPINKSLWTSSYAVFMAGMALTCFAVCYWLVDVQGWRKGTKPFAIYGMNAITVFFLAGMLGRISLEVKVSDGAGNPVSLKSFLYGNFFAPFGSPDTAPFLGFLASPRNASLLWALVYVLLLYGVAWLMYRRHWFIKF